MNKTNDFKFNLPAYSDPVDVEDLNDNFRGIDDALMAGLCKKDYTGNNMGSSDPSARKYAWAPWFEIVNNNEFDVVITDRNAPVESEEATINIAAGQTFRKYINGRYYMNFYVQDQHDVTFKWFTNAETYINESGGGAGAGTVKSVGASTGLKTDQPSGAAINMTGTVKLDLTSETPFEGTAPAPVEIEDKLYPVALDAAGHPAVSVPGTEYTQGAGINISENNVITNTGVFDVTVPTSSDTTATNGDIKVIKKVVNNGVTTESVEFVKPKGINDPAFKALDSSTSGLTSDDNHVPTSKTVQDAIDTALASASIYKGTISAFNDLPTSTATDTVRKGWYYRVSTAWSAATGTPATHVGDIIIAEKDSPSKAIDSANWSLLHNEANTDANVTQSPVSTNANYEVLFSGSADNTSHTEGTGKDSGLTYNPSTNKLTVSGEVSASSYSGLPEGNTTTKGIVQLGTDADKAASGDHVHGNITNGGALQTTDVSIASGDKLVITDASDSNKVARASVSFDGSTATQALTKKGTFENFQAPISASKKLSSDFVDDTNKTHRFATADQLTQIATNKTNILYGIKTGAKNQLKLTGTVYNPNTLIVIWDYKNGTVRVTGSTPTTETVFINLGTWTAPEDDTYRIYANSEACTANIRVYDNGTWGTYTAEFSNEATWTKGTTRTLFLRIAKNVVVGDITVTPMICQKSIFDADPTFAPYALPNYELTVLEAEDRAALAEEIDGGAKNKLQNNATSNTIKGVTFTVNSDGSISTYGTSNAGDCIFYINQSFKFESGVRYVLTGCPSGGSSDGYRLCNMGATYINDFGYGGEVTGDGSTREIAIYIKNSGTNMGTAQSPKKFYPMITTKAAFGVSKNFTPYRVPITGVFFANKKYVTSTTEVSTGVKFTAPSTAVYKITATATYLGGKPMMLKVTQKHSPTENAYNFLYQESYTNSTALSVTGMTDLETGGELEVFTTYANATNNWINVVVEKIG